MHVDARAGFVEVFHVMELRRSTLDRARRTMGEEAARRGRELLLSVMTEEELDRITGPGRPSLSGTVGEGPSRKRQVRLPAQLDELLELRIAAEGRGASEILRDALEQYLRAS